MQISDLKPGSHIHLMGICGTAMASLAGLLKDRGYKVTGSDQNPYPPMSTQLEQIGIEIQKGYSAQNLHPTPDFVIVGNVISASNPEAQELVKLGIPYTSLPKAMGETIIANRESIVVSGTHGKTTTTSLMAWTCEVAGLKPGFLIGGIPKNFSRSFANPQGNWFVIEGDEYDTAYFDKVPKFIHYRPKHVILTSVEFDHADIYKDLDDVKSAFAKLLKLIPENGTLAWCAHEKNIRDLLSSSAATLCKNIFSYGLFGCGADFEAKIISSSERGTEIEIYHKQNKIDSLHVNMNGDYNVLNALAVYVIASTQKMNLEKIREAFSTFEGVKRRQEILGEPDGVLVIEDFAHHPTAVRETIKAVQKKYSPRRVFSIFEPRSATSRRKVFQRDYVEAFSEGHEVLLAKAFDQTKIDEANRFSSEELVSDLRKAGKSAECFDNADQIVGDLLKRTSPKDVILIMSNGGFDGIYTKLLSQLREREQARQSQHKTI